MPTEKQIYYAASEVNRLAEKLGVQVEADYDSTNGKTYYNVLYQADGTFYWLGPVNPGKDHVPARFRQIDSERAFESIFEVLGYLRAVYEIEGKRLVVYSVDAEVDKLKKQIKTLKSKKKRVKG